MNVRSIAPKRLVSQLGAGGEKIGVMRIVEMPADWNDRHAEIMRWKD